MTLRSARWGAVPIVAALTMSACTTTTNNDANSSPSSTGSKPPVVLATHESWAMSDEVLKKFTEETGYPVQVKQVGDAGAMTNQLILTKDAPIADAVFGIDNTFASRAVDAGALATVKATNSVESAAQFALPGEAANQLLPVDFSDVCLNVDNKWFEAKGLAAPASLDDLIKPEYKDLTVVPGASTSSPGMAFLLATVAKYGEDGWKQWWTSLVGNGVKLVPGWSEAYEIEFSNSGKGDRPIVVSYDSSPPFTVPDGSDKPTTSAVLSSCFRQVEYAGVLNNAKNPEGAAALVNFMQTPEFQAALPTSMYVFPVDTSVELPAEWAKWATRPDNPLTLDPATIATKRDEWLKQWAEVTGT